MFDNTKTREAPDATMKKGFVPDLAEKAGLADRVPTNEVEAAHAEAVFVAEMEKLSLRDQEQVMLEMAGLNPLQEESPGFVASKLSELEQEIGKIKRKAAYDEAIRGDKRYVASEKFRMQFLRSEHYNPTAAANLMIEHFRMKRELFGNGEILSREVLLDDLNRDARDFVEKGYLQVSRSKDTAGRAVVWWGSCVLPKIKSVKALQKANWYMMNALARDVETQINGSVFVIFTGGKPEDFGVFKALVNLRVGLSIHVSGCHICNTTATMRFFLAGARLFLDSSLRERLREHGGDDFDQTNFALQTFGIDTGDSPLLRDGSWSTEWHKQWLHMQHSYEQNNFKNEIIITPRRFDVLFGKTKQAKEHTGTLRCQVLVDMYWEEYDNASKDEKTAVANKIVGIIHASNGRFLKAKGKEGWEEVDSLAARHKVAHFFRGIRERRTKQQQQEDDKSQSSASKKRNTEPLEDARITSNKRTSPSYSGISDQNNVDEPAIGY